MTDTTQTGVSQSPVAQDNATTNEDTFQDLFDNGAFEAEPPINDDEEPPRGEESEQGDEAQQGDEPPPRTEAKKPGEEEATYQSLEEYFAKQNVDFESIRSLPVTVKIDGETKAVPLSDVLKSYQLEGHVNNKSQQLSEAQRVFDAERLQAQTFIRGQLDQAGQIAQLAQQQLLGEYNRIDWNTLRATDPGQWAAKQTEFQQAQLQIQQHLGQVQQQQAFVAQQQQTELQRQQEANLPREREKLIQYRAEWSDPQKFQADREVALKAGRSLGFSDAEIGQYASWDSRFLIALDKIGRFDALQAAAPEAAKRVRAAPQMARPGVRVNRNPSQANRTQLKERFEKDSRNEDAAAAYFETLA